MAAALLDRQPERAKNAAGRLCDLFGRDRVWIELQHHYLPEDDGWSRGWSSWLARSTWRVW